MGVNYNNVKELMLKNNGSLPIIHMFLVQMES